MKIKYGPSKYRLPNISLRETFSDPLSAVWKREKRRCWPIILYVVAEAADGATNDSDGTFYVASKSERLDNRAGGMTIILV